MTQCTSSMSGLFCFNKSCNPSIIASSQNEHLLPPKYNLPTYREVISRPPFPPIFPAQPHVDRKTTIPIFASSTSQSTIFRSLRPSQPHLPLASTPQSPLPSLFSYSSKQQPSASQPPSMLRIPITILLTYLPPYSSLELLSYLHHILYNSHHNHDYHSTIVIFLSVTIINH